MNTKQCNLQGQLENAGVLLDGKWAFNPVKRYSPKFKDLQMFMYDVDSTQACNRFKYKNYPSYFPAYLIEQMAYNRSVLCFYKSGNSFKLLPCVSNGNLNDYGLSEKAMPIAYNGKIDSKNQKNMTTEYLTVDNYNDFKDLPADKKCVLFFDRVNGMRNSKGGACVPKALLQHTVIDEMVNRLSFLNINLVNSQGKNIILVKDPKQKKAVEKSLEDLYASDKSYAIVKSMFDVQVINNDIDYEEQTLWEDAMSWNNLRLLGLGIDNNGLFNKKEREISGELNANSSQTQILHDAFFESRKLFVQQIKDVFGDDPDFQRDFKDFDVVDLQAAEEASNQPTNEEEGEDDDDNIMF